jgi:putative transposase
MSTKEELVRLLAEECRDMNDVTKMLKGLFGEVISEMLEAEMDVHLGYDKNSVAGNNSGNSRNGHNVKTVKSEFGTTTINVPRDRNGEFEPKAVAKYKTKSDDIETRIMAMYAKGMSNRDIEDHLRDIYGVDASPALISRITDKILPEVGEWQARYLESIYAIVYFDGIQFNVRKDSRVVKKCAYTVLGVDMDGHKDILGIWISDNESASFWTGVCNDLRNRGVEDILIACHDNLTGLVKAIAAVYPHTDQQLCVIHQIRNSTKHVSYNDLKAVMADLKRIYKATTMESAETAMDDFDEKWEKKYPQIMKSWRENWAELSTYFKYPEQVRTIIYTTNAVEGFHRMLRKYTKTKTIFPTDDALRKSIYLSVGEISKKWTMPVKNWGVIVGQLMIYFEDRLEGVVTA